MSQNNITNSECGTEDFVTLEQAEKLKELDFNWETYACYNHGKFEDPFDRFGEATIDNHNRYGSNYISAPTLSQAQKWLREIHNIIIIIEYQNAETFNWIVYKSDKLMKSGIWGKDTYEEALSIGISKALELIENGEY